MGRERKPGERHPEAGGPVAPSPAMCSKQSAPSRGRVSPEASGTEEADTRRVSFLIPGGPPLWQRTSEGRRNTTRTKSDENAVALLYATAARRYPRPVHATGGVRVTIAVYVNRPRKHYRADSRTFTPEGKRNPLPIRTPDVDNIAKAVLDGLKHGGAYKDDQQVTALHVFRRWLVFPSEEHTSVTVEADIGPWG